MTTQAARHKSNCKLHAHATTQSAPDCKNRIRLRRGELLQKVQVPWRRSGRRFWAKRRQRRRRQRRAFASRRHLRRERAQGVSVQARSEGPAWRRHRRLRRSLRRLWERCHDNADTVERLDLVVVRRLQPRDPELALLQLLVTSNSCLPIACVPIAQVTDCTNVRQLQIVNCICLRQFCNAWQGNCGQKAVACFRSPPPCCAAAAP